jgi:hypothetical protein
MRFTQAQVRELVGIPEETYRAWRKALPPLREHNGHAPTFTLGNILALTSVNWLVRCYGAKVSHLTLISSELFESCERATVAGIDASWLVISEDAVTLTLEAKLSSLDRPCFVIPIHFFLSSIRRSVSSAEDATQQSSLRLQPAAL